MESDSVETVSCTPNVHFECISWFVGLCELIFLTESEVENQEQSNFCPIGIAHALDAENQEWLFPSSVCLIAWSDDLS